MSSLSGNSHLPYLDGWRGLAIVCLLIGHFFAVPGINFGTVGVNLFFVLSGLLMARILFVQKTPLRYFYKRRIARVFPSVYAYLALVSTLFWLGGREVSMLELLSAATFTNNYITPATTWTMPFGHIWSLSVEEHAYVVLSIVALAARASTRRSVRALALSTGIIAFIACLYGIGVNEAAGAGRWGQTEVASFGIFASGLLLLCGTQTAQARQHPLAVPALLLLGLAAHWWSVPGVVRLLVGCGAFALAVNSLHRAPALLHALLEWAPLRQLGVWSFSLYLWQQPFYQLVHRFGMDPVLGVALSLLTGATAFYVLEKPARAWLNRVWSGAAPVPLAVSTPEDDEAETSVPR
jgi:peptidoglycan/LPS O-acetylase OafA/YrhL